MPATLPAVGLIGAGQMAAALARGWGAAGVVDPARSLASGPRAATRERFTDRTGWPAVADNRAVVAAADVVVLAVKPHLLAGVCADLRETLAARHLVVSIASGVTLGRLAGWLGESVRLVRVMPNTPSLVGAGAAGFSPGPAATSADADTVRTLFGAVGRAVEVPERLIDAVTGVSGCGPAFVYLMIEALADGGVRAGLPRATAQELAAQTVLGAAKMVLDTGEHPGALKDAVCSPGGATIAGIFALEQAGFRGAVMSAVAASAARAAEQGKAS